MIYLCRNCGSFSGLTNLHISSTIHPSPKDTKIHKQSELYNQTQDTRSTYTNRTQDTVSTVTESTYTKISQRNRSI